MFKRICSFILFVTLLLSVFACAAGGTAKLGVHKIEDEAFSGDTSLTSFTIGEDLTYIGSEAFKNCTGLETVYCFNDDVEIEEDAFDGVENATVYCNCMSSMDLYAQARNLTVKYLNAFETACDTADEDASICLPITWSVVNPMPGRDIQSTFTYRVFKDGAAAPVYETTTSAQSVTYTPTEGGDYYVEITMANALTTTTLSTGKTKVGTTLTMGTWNGKKIEWQVLTVDGKRALITTKQGIILESYFNPEWIKFKYTYWSGPNIGAESSNYRGSQSVDVAKPWYGITHSHIPLDWDGSKWGSESDLYYLHARHWCNDVFYQQAFTSSERSKIITVTNKNPDSPAGIDGGPDTTDKVFFLSYNEVLTYMPTAADRIMKNPNNYGWWTRTPGKYRVNAIYIDIKGTIHESGNDVGHKLLYRPAMWIKVGN